MPTCNELISQIKTGLYDGVFSHLYAPGFDPEAARLRAVQAAEGLLQHCPSAQDKPAALFSAPGRTELGGNHTDHQNGHVLCAAIHLDLLACAVPNGENTIRVFSKGYTPACISLEDLLPSSDEAGTSAALVRGVAAGIAAKGYPVSGFDAFVLSDLPSGGGLSSSAAYEVLIGIIINHFFCQDALTPVELAQIGQQAENRFFGKPCGLMDQLACAVGGTVCIDFADPTAPCVEPVSFDFNNCGHFLCLADTGSHHADLTADYAAVPAEMKAIAAYFGKEVLRQVSQQEFYFALPVLRQQYGDRAVLRAMHFYREDRRAMEEAAALNSGNLNEFFALVNDSRLSSSLLLQNTFSLSAPGQQPIPVALAAAAAFLDGAGAVRLHGGGFAGAIQAFIPCRQYDMFKEKMELVLGPGCCRLVHIRPQGGCVILP